LEFKKLNFYLLHFKKMNTIIDDSYRWKRKNIDEYLVHYIGDFKILRECLNKIAELRNNLNSDKVNSILNNVNGSFAVIMESSDSVIAFTDRLCSYPVFYTTSGDIIVSNNARKLHALFNYSEWDKLSVEEFSMAGYVTGSNTLVKGLKRLQSAEIMVLNKLNNHVNIYRYFRYLPIQEMGRSNEDWIDELDYVMSNVVQRMVDRANGDPIRVPLSAGLDSRLLVSKLHESKYDNLETFSYGPKGNWESKGARAIAKRLDLPWELITTNRREARKMFWSPERNDYWKFSDGMSALPSFQDYYTISKLHSMKKFPEDVILINGQSGDFITGGHIPNAILQSNASVHTLLDSIVNKHYSIWNNIITPDRIHNTKEKVLELMGIGINDKLTVEELASLYECWEYEERQSKWVVHGQRIYDFFGYKWQLPLWDNELVDFYKRVPIHLKQDQLLYKLWLERWNYKKLFSDFNPVVWRWPGVTLSVVPIAKAVELIFDKDVKRQWYELFYYWGHNREHYSPYSYAEYFKVRSKIRNNIGLDIRTWAKENSIPKKMIDLS
jgi:asparagine synthase (glutamine-hydrolysing)